MDLAAVYSRELDGQILTLAPSGWTYKRTFVLYDRETGSLWYPKGNGLMAIQGPHFKKRLARLPTSDTRWSRWQKAHPESKLMK